MKKEKRRWDERREDLFLCDFLLLLLHNSAKCFLEVNGRNFFLVVHKERLEWLQQLETTCCNTSAYLTSDWRDKNVCGVSSGFKQLEKWPKLREEEGEQIHTHLKHCLTHWLLRSLLRLFSLSLSFSRHTPWIAHSKLPAKSCLQISRDEKKWWQRNRRWEVKLRKKNSLIFHLRNVSLFSSLFIPENIFRLISLSLPLSSSSILPHVSISTSNIFTFITLSMMDS